MSPDAVARVVDRILVREGGPADIEGDRGGPTRFGVTLAFLEDWSDGPISQEQFDSLRAGDARRLFTHFLVKTRIAEINSEGLADAVGDFAVHSGLSVAVRRLQRAAGVQRDGLLGPVTLAACNGSTLDADRLRLAVLAARTRYLADIVVRDPDTQLQFLVGWLVRVGDQMVERYG